MSYGFHMTVPLFLISLYLHIQPIFQSVILNYMPCKNSSYSLIHRARDSARLNLVR